VKRTRGRPSAAQATRGLALAWARWAWDGLIGVLAGSDPVPEWKLRSPQERRTAYVVLAMATLAFGVVNVASIHPAAGPHHLLAGIAPKALGHLPRHLLLDLVALAAVAPLPLAVRYPLMAWRIGWLALLLVPLAPATWWGGWPWGPPQVLALLVAFGVAGLRYRRSVLWSMWALTLAPWWLWLQADISNLNGPVSATIVFTAATIALDSISIRSRAQRALAAQTERAEAERATRAVLEERTRIARELHDVVAHHMSLIAVRAETAPYRLVDLPEPARSEFGALSAEAREALADMRRLLGVLRRDEPASFAPQPELSDLQSLVDAARQAGVSVELWVPPALDQVPSAIGVCAYRIVQESLSNVSQHAPGATVTVSVNQESGAMTLRVANGPGGSKSAGVQRGTGHGLNGMRERVALLGGSLSAGPAPDGGFVVSAVLPFCETA
jgi:signal transduction histidine kinase